MQPWKAGEVVKSRKTQTIYRLLRLLDEGTNHQQWECQRLSANMEPLGEYGGQELYFDVRTRSIVRPAKKVIRWLGFEEYYAVSGNIS